MIRLVLIMKHSHHKKSLGFTLVELIVAVSILAILTAAGLGVYSSVRKDYRDSTRLSHLSQIKQALELYRSANRYYPENRTVLVPTYIAKLPTDPLSNTDYGYIPAGCTSGQCSSFILCATKEGNKSFDFPAGCPPDKRIGLVSD